MLDALTVVFALHSDVLRPAVVAILRRWHYQETAVLVRVSSAAAGTPRSTLLTLSLPDWFAGFSPAHVAAVAVHGIIEFSLCAAALVRSRRSEDYVYVAHHFHWRSSLFALNRLNVTLFSRQTGHPFVFVHLLTRAPGAGCSAAFQVRVVPDLEPVVTHVRVTANAPVLLYTFLDRYVAPFVLGGFPAEIVCRTRVLDSL